LVKVLEVIDNRKGGDIDIAGADVIVSGGGYAGKGKFQDFTGIGG